MLLNRPANPQVIVHGLATGQHGLARRHPAHAPELKPRRTGIADYPCAAEVMPEGYARKRGVRMGVRSSARLIKAFYRHTSPAMSPRLSIPITPTTRCGTTSGAATGQGGPIMIYRSRFPDVVVRRAVDQRVRLRGLRRARGRARDDRRPDRVGA